MKTFLNRFILLWILGLVCAVGAQTATSEGNVGGSLLLSFEGTVEVAEAGSTVWRPARKEQPLKPGDRVRTGKNSRAMVRLSNLSVLRVYELSTLEIQPPQQQGNNPGIDVKKGSVYFFNRDRPSATQFRTPVASGAIRGTEFNLTVAEDGRMLLTVIDGVVDLQNELGSLELLTGEQAVAEPGKAPQKTAAVDAINVIQWTLYYPGVLNPDDLRLSDDLKNQLAPSLNAYRQGDLLKAVELYPFERESQSPDDKIYRAMLFLAVGKVDEAVRLIENLGSGQAAALGEALKELIAAVKHQPFDRAADRTLATEWMADSYHRQSQGDLEGALHSARAAAAQSPDFGFAHARVAELEFSFGRIDAALEALETALDLSPRNAQALATKGFLLSAHNRVSQARSFFEKAIEVDSALANAWLGRGLMRIKKGDVEGGRKDLETAAALEPNRSVLRSYLGKAWSMGRAFRYSWDQMLADKELNLARRLDPGDPTPWLYSALLNQQQNEVNAAIEDLEMSQSLNDNRRLFRSKMLLDQDRAVRSANLASIYRDAGMVEYSVREASRAVDYDPANASAHLFLSESFDALRDPKAVNNRFETAWSSELLLANLLAPVGAANLSQNISQQEYSRLFESDRLGLFSRTEYQSAGDWFQQASQFGTIGNSAYALDVDYRSIAGQRINDDFELRYYSAKFKQQITPQDSVFLQITAQEIEAGDVLQYYNQSQANDNLRIKDEQVPNLFLGYHRQWTPEHRTLLLLGRLNDQLDITSPRLSGGLSIVTLNTNGIPTLFSSTSASLTNRREFTAYSAELQHIAQAGRHTLIGGARFQTGESDNASILRKSGISNVNYRDRFDTDLQRISVYAYDFWQIVDPLQLYAGVTYDNIRFPLNTDIAPISRQEQTREQISPKGGLRYTPWEGTTFRAAYTRSLGGLFFDNSVRLEPTQIAGFNQAFRSIIPESVVGSVAGSRFTTYGVGVEQRIRNRTYLTLEAELLESEASRTFGVFTFQTPPPGVPVLVTLSPSGTTEQLRFQERALTFTVNQLLGDEWIVGGRYRLSDAHLKSEFVGLPGVTGVPNRNLEATLHQANVFVIYHHRCGFFARPEALWVSQSNRGIGAMPGDDFWQLQALAGYRFARRQAEIRVGVLNIFDQDYRLSPLNFHLDFPRERTFVASFKFHF